MASNFNVSDYGKNRYSAKIIYPGADGDYELTKDAFLASDSSLTEADFDFWKNWSDTDFKSKDRADTREVRRTRAIDQFADTELLADESTEDTVLEALEPTPNPYTYDNAVKVMDDCLTDTQKRRFLFHKCNGMTLECIAEMESVSITAVFYSISAAEKNILRYLAKHT